MGKDVAIMFVRDLDTKYYFEVIDPHNDSIYDVYVDKQKLRLQQYRTP